MSNRELALEILGHLGAALCQCIPSDDQIIVGHIRDAKDLVSKLVDDLHKDENNDESI